MTEQRERFTANRADIGEMCALIEQFLTRQGMERQETARMRLTMERLLERISERLGWGTHCELALGRRMGRVRIVLSYAGASFDPTLIGRESAGDVWSARLLTDLGFVPEWSFRRGVNRLVLRPCDRRGGAQLASFAALALAAALRLAADAAGCTAAVSARACLPFLRALLGTADVLLLLKLFFSVLRTVCGVGETASLGRMGRMLPARFIGFTCLWALLGTAATAALCRLPFTGAADLSLLWGIFPTDARSFFGGTLWQTALVAGLAGAALLSLGGRASHARAWAEECDAALAAAVEGVCRLTPAAVLAAGFLAPPAAFLRAWKPLAAFLLCGCAAVAASLAEAFVRLRIAPHRLFKRLLPPLRSALRTGRFAAVFGPAMDNCENALGVKHELVLTGLSAGGVLCVPFGALGVSAAAMFLSAERDGSAGAGALTMTALAGVLLAAAAFRRPGLLLPCLALVLPDMGAEELALAAALETLLAVPCAAFDTLILQLELLLQADRLELLDKRRLE